MTRIFCSILNPIDVSFKSIWTRSHNRNLLKEKITYLCENPTYIPLKAKKKFTISNINNGGQRDA